MTPTSPSSTSSLLLLLSPSHLRCTCQLPSRRRTTATYGSSGKSHCCRSCACCRCCQLPLPIRCLDTHRSSSLRLLILTVAQSVEDVFRVATRDTTLCQLADGHAPAWWLTCDSRLGCCFIQADSRTTVSVPHLVLCVLGMHPGLHGVPSQL